MVPDSIEAVLLRQDVFAVALALLFGAALVPETLTVASVELRLLLSAVGGLYVVARLLYGAGLVLRTTYVGWQAGQREARREG
jgi:hypothetical protein